MRSAAAFLQWLPERGRSLEECGQADVDAWLAGDRADRYNARSFARWAMAHKLMPKLDFPAGWRGGPSPPVHSQDPVGLAQRLLPDPRLSARDRVAGVLIALFAQPVSRVARLTADDLTLDGSNVAIRFGDTAVSMPEPVARDVQKLLAELPQLSPRAVQHHQWLFPGSVASRPIGELVLSRRMKRIGVDCKQARPSALLQLAGRLPAAIVADLIGGSRLHRDQMGGHRRTTMGRLRRYAEPIGRLSSARLAPRPLTRHGVNPEDRVTGSFVIRRRQRRLSASGAGSRYAIDQAVRPARGFMGSAQSNSKASWAASDAVKSPMSCGGLTVLMSIATIGNPLSMRTIRIPCAAVRLPQLGAKTPGATEGSKTSMSQQTYTG
jgi:hypothetical protein